MPAQRSELAEASQSMGPAGLEYPPDIQLVRRRPISLLTTDDGTALDWLMSGTAALAGPAELLDGVIARLVAAGQPIERATLNMSTLHPQLLGITANWRGDLGVCDEVEVNAHIRETTDYLTSPLRPIIEEGRSIRVNPQDPVAQSTYPIMQTLAAAGYTDYWGFALKRDDRQFTLMTLATREAGGFSSATIEAVEALRPALALNVEIVSRGKIAEHVLDAYLGRRIGKRVLAGDIRRGFGETIDAVIWVSDMRNFTSLSDRIDSAEMIRLLNAFFEASCGCGARTRRRGPEIRWRRHAGDLPHFRHAAGASRRRCGTRRRSERFGCRGRPERGWIRRADARSFLAAARHGNCAASWSGILRQHRLQGSSRLHCHWARRQSGGAHRIAIENDRATLAPV